MMIPPFYFFAVRRKSACSRVSNGWMSRTSTRLRRCCCVDSRAIFISNKDNSRAGRRYELAAENTCCSIGATAGEVCIPCSRASAFNSFAEMVVRFFSLASEPFFALSFGFLSALAALLGTPDGAFFAAAFFFGGGGWIGSSVSGASILWGTGGGGGGGGGMRSAPNKLGSNGIKSGGVQMVSLVPRDLRDERRIVPTGDSIGGRLFIQKKSISNACVLPMEVRIFLFGIQFFVDAAEWIRFNSWISSFLVSDGCAI